MRDEILQEIRRLAALSGGHPPGQKGFARETGMAEHLWRGKYWARWGDALIEAGFRPNEWTGRLDSEEVLTGIIAACRHYCRVPTRDEIAIFRATEPSIPSEQAIKRHFGRRAELITALRRRASEDDAYADLLNILPEASKASDVNDRGETQARTAEGFVYLIGSGEFYKVGRSNDLERRVKEIRISMPEKAVLVHSIRTDDPSGIEAYWHRRFADKRANGEWFKLSPLDVAAFKKRKFQ